MLQTLLELFTTTQKAEAMLESPLIKVIFMALFGLFIITLLVHIIVFLRIRSKRNYVKQTKRLDIEPLQSIKTEFETRQAEEAIKIETFIQEKFSNWRILQMPVVNLIKLVQMTVSVFILLGVLGTFIGLTMSLGSISATSDELVENVSAVLSGIDVAFYTSIVGMSFSLIMTVLTRVLNTEYLLTDLMLVVESLLESEEQHGMNRMIAVSETINDSILHLQQTNEKSLGSIVDAFGGFRDYTEGLQQSAKDLAAFNDGLSHNLEKFHELFNQMTAVTDDFRDGTDRLNENFDALFSYFERMSHRNERMTTAFENTSARIQDVTDSQIKSLQEFDGSVTELKTFTTSLLDGQTEARDSLENINQKTRSLVDTMAAQTTVMKNIFGDDLSAKLDSLSAYLADLKKGFDHVGDSIGTLPEALAIINQTQQANHQLLGDRFREVKQFNETFGEHLKKHESETANFENHLRAAASTFKELSNKNNELIQEMNRSLSAGYNQLSQRDQQVASNTADMKDSLENHAARVENTLSQKLDTMVRQMENSLYTMNDGMNRQLTEMQRTAGEMNQHHARLMQQLLQQLGREIQTLHRQPPGPGPGLQQNYPSQNPRLNNDE